MAIGVGYARMGEFAKADAAVKHAKEVAEGGDIIARIDTMIGESMVAVTRGDLDVAIPLAQQLHQHGGGRPERRRASWAATSCWAKD